jgi:ubiquinone/menaquinone biosynthesis C-methylase UbiE
MLHALADFANKEVLEVGCGDGRLTWQYADQARTALALDPSAPAIADARAILPDSLRSRVTFVVADITTADLPRAAFDVALFAWSLC